MRIGKQGEKVIKRIRGKRVFFRCIAVFSILLTSDVAHGEDRKRILFLGDSLTAGYGLSQSQAYPALIQRQLDENKLAFTSVNAGLSGETSAGGLRRISWLMREKISVFVLGLGANDALRGLPVETTARNLDSIISKVRGKYPEASCLILGMLAPPNMGQDYGERFRKMYIDLAKRRTCTLLPFMLEGVAGNPEFNLADGMHPNAEGQRVVAANVWRYLLPIVTRSSSRT